MWLASWAKHALIIACVGAAPAGAQVLVQKGTLGGTVLAGPRYPPSDVLTRSRDDAGPVRRQTPLLCPELPRCGPDAIERIARHDWWAPIASAALPGAGQARLGQDRFVGYMAVEGFLWIRYLADRRAGIEARNTYRDLAARVSRAGFPGSTPQGNWEYYERMEHWIASGAYNGNTTGGFTPETDTTTFNGKMWSIARATFWADPRTPPPIGSPAYEAALGFYNQNAVRPEFEWSWRSSPLHQDVYRRSVRSSNDGFRHAAQDIGAVIANHVLSTVDAYISLRLRLGESGENRTPSVGLGATVSFATISQLVNHPTTAAGSR